ncbi:MAG: hypothetical protein LBT24_04050 [Tannerella sp.]|jgi:hypothetical protein|nr:hypothetical protein [Tannerella sp.]
MINKISKTEAFEKRMEEAGKISILDRPEDIRAINEMNKQMEIVRREYRIKDRNSQSAASLVILTV